MAFTNTGFTINGITNTELGIASTPSIVRTDSQIETPWIGNKQIIESSVPYSDCPYFYGTQKEPISFRLKFSILEDEYTHDKLLALGRIFGKDEYVSFKTEDDADKIYYVIPNGGINLITFGQFQGWYEIDLRTNAPYAWSIEETHTISATPTSQYTINNISNVMNSKYKDYRYYPRMTIALTGGSTEMTITNTSDSNRATAFTTLTAGETLTIDNKLKILTSSTGSNRFTNFNKNWLYLVEGNNTLQFSHQATITITTQFPIYV